MVGGLISTKVPAGVNGQTLEATVLQSHKSGTVGEHWIIGEMLRKEAEWWNIGGNELRRD